MACAALLMSVLAPLEYFHRGGALAAKEHLKGGMFYSIAFLSADYFDFGFIRRGLGGTIAHLFSADPYRAALAFHLFSALLLIASLAAFQLRLRGRTNLLAASFMAAFIAFSPQTFAAWSWDAGRTDLLVMALIAAAALAQERSRPLLAALLLWVGSLAHETALIFGIPLLTTLAVARADGGSPRRRREWLALATLAVAVLATMLLQATVAPSRAAFVGGMLARIPLATEQVYEDLRDCAVYMMTTGFRGVRTALCFNAYYPWYPLMVLAAVLVAAANALALGLDRRPLLFVLAAALPMLFMNVVANDVGRWLKLAVAGSWILSCVLQCRGELALAPRRVALGAVIVLVLLPMGATRVHQVSPAIATQIAARFDWPPYPDTGVWMTHCDPQWRAIVHHTTRRTDPR